MLPALLKEASLCVSTLPQALCQKCARDRNKRKESRLFRSGRSIHSSLRRKNSYLFDQSRVFLFSEIGKNKQTK